MFHRAKKGERASPWLEGAVKDHENPAHHYSCGFADERADFGSAFLCSPGVGTVLYVPELLILYAASSRHSAIKIRTGHHRKNSRARNCNDKRAIRQGLDRHRQPRARFIFRGGARASHPLSGRDRQSRRPVGGVCKRSRPSGRIRSGIRPRTFNGKWACRRWSRPGHKTR